MADTGVRSSAKPPDKQAKRSRSWEVPPRPERTWNGMERRRKERRSAAISIVSWKEDAPVAFPDYQQYGQAPSVAGHAAAPAGRPATLTDGYLDGVVAGLSSILGGALLISGAHQAAEDATRPVIGGTSL